MDPDVLDIEVPCYICKEMVILGNDYRCHLNFAHDIFDTWDVDKYINLAQKRLAHNETEEITLEEEEDSEDPSFAKNGTYQCEICGEAFEGRDVIEAHVDSLHLDIVEELEEEVADFYVLLPEVTGKSTTELLTADEIEMIYEKDKVMRSDVGDTTTTNSKRLVKNSKQATLPSHKGKTGRSGQRQK